MTDLEMSLADMHKGVDIVSKLSLFFSYFPYIAAAYLIGMLIYTFYFYKDNNGS